jgi:hypothetical protein
MLGISLAGRPAGASAKENPHTDLDQYESAATCLACHENTARDVVETVHYQFKGTSRQGANNTAVTGGVLAGYVPYAGGAGTGNWLFQAQPADKGKPAQIAGCALCHVGHGASPSAKIGPADIANVDCLMCHGEGYQRMGGKIAGRLQIEPVSGQNLLAIARKAGKPTAEMCQRCHAGAGGGINHRGGVVPTAESDVHFSMGMACTECHSTVKHRIAGGGDLKALEPVTAKVACENCHTLNPHKAASKDETTAREATVFNSHAQKIACQTCHIPAIARDPAQPTIVERDWTKPVLNAATGLYLPTDKQATTVRAEYRWWNGTFSAEGEPVGVPRDGRSKIFAWKKTKYILVADAVSGQPVSLNLERYAVTGDVDGAARAGAADVRQTYSGKWRPVEKVEFTLLNHQVAPKDKALRCGNCHDPNGVMDMKALRPSKRR